MNERSLTHNVIKNQQRPSWIDDPFDLKGFVTGVTPLTYQKSLEEFALELVNSYAEFIGNQYELNLDRISSPYQLELVRLYIESIDREIEWACYGNDQSINSEFLCAMLAMLKNSTPHTRTAFAQVTTRNLIEYYKDELQKILDTACHDLHCAEMNESGYYSTQCQNDGEYYWSKS